MRQRIVGIADLQVSNDVGEVLVTYSLGSCIGLLIYDPQAKVGGLLHYMLPDSSLDPSKAVEKPAMFGDTGIPLLFKSAYKLGLEKRRARVVVVGGAQILDDSGYFNIGKRNYAMLRKILWRNNVLIDAEDVGGNVNRTVYLELATGRIWVKTPGQEMREL
ncbi:MAG: chemotaxis protein CheD [Thermodesulfobacteriota bacterium]